MKIFTGRLSKTLTITKQLWPCPQDIGQVFVPFHRTIWYDVNTLWCEHPSTFMLSISLSFKHYFNVFWWKVQPSEKNTRENTAIVVTKNKGRIKNWFFWTDDEIQFLDSLANSNFGCYCSRSASLIIISILRAVNVWIALNEFIIITMSSSLSISSLLLRILICINRVLCSN